MTCPREDEILLFPELDPETRERILGHAEGCSACADRIRAVESLDSILAGDHEPFPDRLLARIRAIPDGGPSSGGAPTWRIPLRAALAAAAAFLIAVLLLDEREPAPPSPASPVSRAETGVATTATPALRDLEPRERVLAALAAPGPESEAFFAEQGDSIRVILARIAVEDDSDAAVAAIRRLGELGRSTALPALREALTLADRRIPAIRALGAIADERSLRDLEPWLSDEAAGSAALAAVATVGGSRAARILAAEVDRREDDRGDAVAALARADGEIGARELLSRLDDPRLAPAILAAIETNEEALLPHLLSIAAGRDRWTARRALRAVAFLAPADAVPVLRRLLAEREVRDAVARALVRIDTPEAGEALMSRPLTDEVRESFRDAGPGLTAWLVERTEGGDLLSRAEAVELLGRTGNPTAVPAIAKLARHRALAPSSLRALGRIGGEEAVAALADLAEEPWLRRDLVHALGETGEPAAVPVLRRLAAKEPALVNPVVRALARIPSPDTVSAILEIASRRNAARALAGMDPDLVLPALRLLGEAKDRLAARAVLKEIDTAPARTFSGRSTIH